ncbi:hypothetical protein BOTBODRAFT_51245 [Botryobasidium botryosum FD-172 SS1]|uniref:Uncharacterized protein n=1 Tax=Botryobasidium botryosum (strain FD-172 SS1) TaxID=930990 RepID=A0A067N7Z5_BOTB1|nr:hypothetical protein BOTBODRAFT_51245 [Botryobasidium botryosum FD-172 SS1]
MKLSSAFAIFAAAVAAIAAPLERRTSNPTEIDILQFALTLEHLEAAYYTQYLGQYDAQAFSDAGFPPQVYERFLQMKGHEVEHVNFLTSAIGSNAVQACEYSFPVHDVNSFVALSLVFEGVGVAAYTGAAQFLSTPAFLTTAASILATESRQEAWVGSDVLKENPWGSAFETPLSLNEVFSLASPFIVSCPSSNAPLAATGLPSLTASAPSSTFYCPGETVTLAFDCDNNSSSPLYVAFFSGLTTTFVPINDDKTVVLPSGLVGTVYAVVTSTGSGTVTDGNTVAGTVALNFGLDPTA